MRSSVKANKRYKEFVRDAHRAKEKSQGVVGRMMELAKKKGDSTAVTTLLHKLESSQIVWKDQKNPYYNMNQIFADFFEPQS